MSYYQVVNGYPSTITISVSTSSMREFESKLYWNHVGTDVYTLRRVYVTFTTDNGYYWCRIFSPSDNQYYSTSGNAGAGGLVTLDLPDAYPDGKIADNLRIFFRRHASYGCTYRDIQLNLEYEANADPSTLSIAPAIAGEPQTVNIANTDDQVYHKVTWGYGSSIKYAAFGCIYSGIDALHLKGNVELWNRPRVSAQEMIDAGYDFDPDSYATLYSITYVTLDKSYTLLMTPIEADGTVHSEDELNNYYDGIIAGATSADAIVAADAAGLKLLIHIMEGEKISDMDYIAVICHNLSEQWENNVDEYGATTASDVIANAISSGPIQFGAATRSPSWAVPSASLTSLYNLCGDRSTIPTCVYVETLVSGNYTLGINKATGYYLSIPQNETTLPEVTIGLTTTQDPIGEDSGEDYLQYHTTLNVTPNGVAKNGASIVSAAIVTPDGTFNGSNGVATNIVVKSYGSYPLQVSVVDSRGFTASATYSPEIVVTPYSPPVITALSVERCLESGRPDDEGGYISVEAAANKTVVTWNYTITQTGHTTIVEQGNLGSDGTAIIGGATLDKDIGYTVTVTAVCEYSQRVSASANVATSLYTIHRMAGGKGVAFGKVSNRYGVEVSEEWPFYTHGKEIQELLVEFSHPVGSIIQTISDSFDPNALWPWTHWSKLEDVFLFGAGGKKQLFDAGGAESGVVDLEIKIDEQPFYLKQDNLPAQTFVSAYTGHRSVTSKLANSGSAYRFFDSYSTPDPLYTMRLGSPKFVMQYDTTAPQDYVIGDYAYKVSGGARVYYRCISPVASGSAWSAGSWVEVQYADIQNEIAVQILWEGAEKVPPGGFAVGDYAFRIVDSKKVLYRCLRASAEYSSWSGDAERNFAEVPYGDAKASATVDTMPPYLAVNIWVRSR